MNCKGCLTLAGLLLLVCIAIVVAFTLSIGRFLAIDDSLSQADAIVVLGGNFGDFPRVQHGLSLFNAGYAPRVVFSGGTLASAGLTCSSATLSLEAAQELGLPSDAAITVEGAESTYDEAANLRRLTQQHGWHTLIIVTDLFHTRRAGHTFRTLLPDTTIQVSAAPDPRYTAGRWWSTEAGLVAVITEVLKLGFYWAKYGIAPVG